MPTANFATVRTRVISLLNANPFGGFVDAVADNDRYSNKDEISQAILDADLEILNEIAQVTNHPFRSQILTPSGLLSSGDKLPACVGEYGAVEVTEDNGATFKPGISVDSRDDVMEAIAYPALYGGAGACLRFYFILDAGIYHTSAKARVFYPNVVKIAAPQSPDAYENALIAGAIGGLGGLFKDGSDGGQVAHYAAQFSNFLAKIRAGNRTIPELQKFERSVD